MGGSVRVAALFSGGKDSTYAAYVACQRGWRVTRLVSLFPSDPASMMWHVPNVRWTPLLAEAMGVPLVSAQAGEGEDAELAALKVLLEDLPVDGVVVGAIASDYQRVRIQRACHELGLKAFAPLWRLDPSTLLREYGRAGMDVAIGAVSAEGLGPEWLGARLDDETVDALLRLHERHGVHPCGEGGEYETLVLDAPFFRQRFVVDRAVVRWEGTAGRWEIQEAHLEPKPSDVRTGAAKI
jgi:ABC transporter with metal-binding/Fe-S-binding domain ATP-binding protein